MQFNEIWLREWVSINLTSKELFNQINMIGLEIRSIKSVTNKFSGIIVGEIIECKKHFNFDKLYITKVNIGRKRPINIVCSEKNCRHGLKVAVAISGSVLPENVSIREIELYGVLSEGILCSFFKLGISENYNHVIELPTDAIIGKDICDYLKLDDNIIEINVTPNRADCLSIIGVSRDIAALNKIKLNKLEILPTLITSNDTLSIQVNVPELCPRYLVRIIRAINIHALTPFWMKERLLRCGIQPTNVIVDITNYVLLELGQPIHIFDKDCIEGGIIVRMAKEGETTVLLDENKITLNADTLVVSDNKKILAVSGIFVSECSSVNTKTRNVLLECAFLNPLAIIGRAKRYGLRTGTSQRYERGVDFMLQYKAIERTTHLLINICGGKVSPILDFSSETYLPKCKTITLYRKKLDRLIGYYISDFQVNEILHYLGFQIIKNKDKWKVIVPSWRFDIDIEEDLIEEIVRIYGYNNVPCQFQFPTQTFLETTKLCYDFSLKRVKALLNDKGYQEIITYSFVNPQVQQIIHPGKKAIILPRPISYEMSVMRLSLWTGLIETVIYNQNRQQSRIRIFETGLRFVPNKQSNNFNICQDLMLAGAVTGNRYEEHWDMPKNSVDFYDVKGDLESIFDLIGKVSEIKFYKKTIPVFHPGQSSSIYLKGKHIGFIGVIHPEVERKLHLNGRTIIFELEWNKISEKTISEIREVSRFPANRRDISIIVPEHIPAEDILAECRKINKNQLIEVNLFDVYRGKELKKGYKSLAISLILQDNERTLEEKEISFTVNRCIEILKNRFQALLRN